ncbi:MAG: hypothetical protein Q6373_022685 [Candidatus Sigynarchaeota archaeon]
MLKQTPLVKDERIFIAQHPAAVKKISALLPFKSTGECKGCIPDQCTFTARPTAETLLARFIRNE